MTPHYANSLIASHLMDPTNEYLWRDADPSPETVEQFREALTIDADIETRANNDTLRTALDTCNLAVIMSMLEAAEAAERTVK